MSWNSAILFTCHFTLGSKWKLIEKTERLLGKSSKARGSFCETNKTYFLRSGHQGKNRHGTRAPTLRYHYSSLMSWLMSVDWWNSVKASKWCPIPYNENRHHQPSQTQKSRKKADTRNPITYTHYETHHYCYVYYYCYCWYYYYISKGFAQWASHCRQRMCSARCWMSCSLAVCPWSTCRVWRPAAPGAAGPALAQRSPREQPPSTGPSSGTRATTASPASETQKRSFSMPKQLNLVWGTHCVTRGLTK